MNSNNNNEWYPMGNNTATETETWNRLVEGLGCSPTTTTIQVVDVPSSSDGKSLESVLLVPENSSNNNNNNNSSIHGLVLVVDNDEDNINNNTSTSPEVNTSTEIAWLVKQQQQHAVLPKNAAATQAIVAVLVNARNQNWISDTDLGTVLTTYRSEIITAAAAPPAAGTSTTTTIINTTETLRQVHNNVVTGSTSSLLSSTTHSNYYVYLPIGSTVYEYNPVRNTVVPIGSIESTMTSSSWISVAESTIQGRYETKSSTTTMKVVAVLHQPSATTTTTTVPQQAVVSTEPNTMTTNRSSPTLVPPESASSPTPNRPIQRPTSDACYDTNNNDNHPTDDDSELENNYNIDGDDDDDITVILLDHTMDDIMQDRNNRGNGGNGITDDWIDQHGPEMEERRRQILLQELKRVQRSSFIHFTLLCMIPTTLLIIVIVTILGNNEPCVSEATYCTLEPRTFVNAFTTRCVCDPIPIARESAPTP